MRKRERPLCVDPAPGRCAWSSRGVRHSGRSRASHRSSQGYCSCPWIGRGCQPEAFLYRSACICSLSCIEGGSGVFRVHTGAEEFHEFYSNKSRLNVKFCSNTHVFEHNIIIIILLFTSLLIEIAFKRVFEHPFKHSIFIFQTGVWTPVWTLTVN